jgi:hypothetical protein
VSPSFHQDLPHKRGGDQTDGTANLTSEDNTIRPIADCDMASLRARLRVDQWVASVGVVSKVSTSTSGARDVHP